MKENNSETKEKRDKGLTLIELMITLAIIAILILAAIFAYRKQLAKGRDAKRKSDLNKLQRVFEDYLNDNLCYSDSLTCGPFLGSLAGYLSEIPCDPINNTYYNYYYSTNSEESCKKWYKIYARLENEDDSVIAKLGCLGGCGPSNNYNYWTGSPNVVSAAQLPGEYWPEIPGSPPHKGVVPTPGLTPAVSPPVSPAVTPFLLLTPTPTPILASTPIPTPTLPGEAYECFSHSACTESCASEQRTCGTCCTGTTKECMLIDSHPLCCYTPRCPK